MPKYEFVAVDFDGTLCTNAFPEIGEPNPVVIGYVRKLAAEGSKIILYTSRENGTRKLLDEAVAFCKAQEIPVHAVNENPWNPYAATIGLKPSDGRKVYADLYIDDKAINPAEIGKRQAARLISTGYDEQYCEFGDCPICGADNPMKNRFCGACGAKLVTAEEAT